MEDKLPVGNSDKVDLMKDIQSIDANVLVTRSKSRGIPETEGPRQNTCNNQYMLSLLDVDSPETCLSDSLISSNVSPSENDVPKIESSPELLPELNNSPGADYASMDIHTPNEVLLKLAHNINYSVSELELSDTGSLKHCLKITQKDAKIFDAHIMMEEMLRTRFIVV